MEQYRSVCDDLKARLLERRSDVRCFNSSQKTSQTNFVTCESEQFKFDEVLPSGGHEMSDNQLDFDITRNESSQTAHKECMRNCTTDGQKKRLENNSGTVQPDTNINPQTQSDDVRLCGEMSHPGVVTSHAHEGSLTGCHSSRRCGEGGDAEGIQMDEVTVCDNEVHDEYTLPIWLCHSRPRSKIKRYTELI